MFVQVIKGRTKDAASATAQGDRWAAEVRPGAIGYLGGTFGVADDGTVVVLARFEDEASARGNSERPEQTAWWSAFEPLLDGPASFRETSDVSLLFGGPSAAAGFVQVMEGTVPDRAKAEALETPELEAQLKEARPDLLGAIRAWFDGGEFVEAAYFTSEGEARSGETSSDFEAPQAEFTAMFGEPTYLDLRQPHHS
ncbi:MAG: hypothetical protein M3Z03_08550 [Actinomycetota bacterium]|nr:hypothetical protein [Actinomycetota bacterium]